MTTAVGSFGTLLKVGDGGGPENFTTIAEVRDISPPALSRDVEEVTHHTSPGGWKEFIATLKDGGQVTFEINWDPANATHSYGTGLLAFLVGSGVKKNFQVVFPTTGTITWAFGAIVTNFAPTGTVSGVLRANVTLRVTGQPTLA